MADTARISIDSPIGPLILSSIDGLIVGLGFGSWNGADPAPPPPELADAAGQLSEYFEGARAEFDLPLAEPRAEFDRMVLAAVARIPLGETASYGAVAVALGLTLADARAVGGANARNALPVLIPCHRVIGANGSLTGYLGGLDRKRFLLEHEARQQRLV